MGAGVVSILFTIGATTWIFTKLQRQSGNNTRQSVIASGIAAVFMFIVVFSILSLIF